MAKVEIIKRPVEQVGSDIKKSAWSHIVESLAIIILGILLIVWPETIIKILAYLVGAFFMIKGGVSLVNYFMENGQNNFFDNRLLTGVVSILIGIVAFVMGENIAGVFRVVIGIIVIYESLVRINMATKLATAGVSSWRYTLILALMMLVIGIFITFSTGAIVALIGWMMILTGIIGIVGDVMFMQHISMIIDKITKNK